MYIIGPLTYIAGNAITLSHKIYTILLYTMAIGTFAVSLLFYTALIHGALTLKRSSD